MPTRSRTAPGLDAYLPMDRRRALVEGLDLPERSSGTALFSDLSGFTPLMEHLSNTLGPQRGAEELTSLLNALFTPLIAEVHAHGGSISTFGGDALTCWFPDLRAADCALAMQRHIATFGPLETPAGPVRFSMKVGLASGPVRRFCVGRPPHGRCDVLAGATMDRMAAAQHHAGSGQVVVDAATAAGLPGAALQPLEDGFAVLVGLPAADAPLPAAVPSMPVPLPVHQVRQWLAQPLYRRLRAGRGALAADLRLATPMFVSFSGLDYDHDPSAGDKLQQYVVLAQEHLAPYEGYLALVSCDDKGSLLYILFGAPIAHEDDPVRALDFAMTFQEAVQTLPFIAGQRIGVSQGRAYAGVLGSAERCTYSVLGDAVNTSARLMQAAQEGQVLVSQRVQKAVGGHYAFRSLGAIALKGKEEPIPIFTPLAADQPWLAVEEEQLVGREAEQQTIAGVLDKAQAGHGQVLFLLGEAGVGKSALVRYILHQAHARGWNTQLSACLSYGQSTPYLPWRTLLEEMARLTPTMEGVERIARLQSVVDALSDPPGQRGYWRARFPLLGEVLGLEVPETLLTRSLEGELRRDNTFRLLEALVRSLAAGRPAAIIVEDAHWADELSLQLAAHIGRGLGDLPLLLVVVQRPPVEALPAALRSLQAFPGTTTLVLAALAQSSALDLARQRLYAAALPPELETLLQERAQGNPFFIEELVRALLEAGCLRREANAVVLQGDWSTLQLPDNIEGLVQARLDRLPEEDRLTLKVSSIIGRTFQRALVREVHPTRPAEPTLARQLDRLGESAFVLLEEAAPAWRYAFGHAILHEVTYGTLLFAQRRQLHGEIGAVLERWHAADLPRVLDLLAYHYARSEVRAKAVHYLHRAGDKARREYANEVALGYYSQALERLLPEEREMRYDLLAGRERIRDLRGEREAQEGDLLEMGRLAVELADARRQVEVLNRRARRAADSGAFEQAHALAQRAWQSAEGQADLAGAAQAQRTLAMVHGSMGEYEEAIRFLDRSRQIYEELEDGLGQTACLISLGTAHLYQGATEQARTYYSRAWDIAHGQDNRQQEALALINLGLVEFHLGNHERTRDYLRQALAASREIGSATNEELALDNLGVVAIALGDVAEALLHYQQALALAHQLQDREGEASILINLGLLAICREEWPRARRLLEEALASCRDMGHRRGEANALQYLGMVHLWTGAPGEALASFQKTLSLRQEIGETGNLLITRAWLGLALMATGQLEQARAAIEESSLTAQTEGYRGDYPEQEIWWAAYQFWTTYGNTRRARQTLERAHSLVQEQAGRIADLNLRRSFLEQVPVNREVETAWHRGEAPSQGSTTTR